MPARVRNSSAAGAEITGGPVRLVRTVRRPYPVAKAMRTRVPPPARASTSKRSASVATTGSARPTPGLSWRGIIPRPSSHTWISRPASARRWTITSIAPGSGASTYACTTAFVIALLTASATASGSVAPCARAQSRTSWRMRPISSGRAQKRRTRTGGFMPNSLPGTPRMSGPPCARSYPRRRRGTARALRPARRHDVLEELPLGRALADGLDAHAVEAVLLKQRGVDALDRDEDVVELRVADDVVHRCAGREHADEARDVVGHVVEVLVHVAREQVAAPGDAREDVVEPRVRDGPRGRRRPPAHVARRAAPRAADRLPVELAGRAAVGEVAEPVHVRAQLADVAHPVGIRRRGDHAPGALVAEGAAQLARVGLR